MGNGAALGAVKTTGNSGRTPSPCSATQLTRSSVGNSHAAVGGARDAWCKLGLLARFLERKEADGDKQSAVDQLQALADNAGKQGDSDAPNWKKVLSELRKDPAELKRKQDNNEERASKRQK